MVMKDSVKTIGTLIDKQKVAFIGSVDSEGFPNMKAMLAPRKREGIRVFYFTTNTHSLRVSQYLQNEKACIYNDSFMSIFTKKEASSIKTAKKIYDILKKYYPTKTSYDSQECTISLGSSNLKFDFH